jgi:hypothetical protein
MRIAVLYNLVEKATSSIPLPVGWDFVLKRFADSYLHFGSGYQHDLYICSSGAPLSLSSKEIFKNLKYESLTYMGAGWDIGAYQYSASKLLNYDFIVCLNSQAHIACADWLGYFAGAFKLYGAGVYGASSSFQVAPHIRTSCIAFSPRLAVQYPLEVRSRYDACVFEHSPENFSIWALAQGLPVRVVTRSGAYSLLESRAIPDVFRRGTQANLLVKDRHTFIYENAEAEERKQLEELADGIVPNEFIYFGTIDRLTARYNWLGKLRFLASRFKSIFS